MCATHAVRKWAKVAPPVVDWSCTKYSGRSLQVGTDYLKGKVRCSRPSNPTSRGTMAWCEAQSMYYTYRSADRNKSWGFGSTPVFTARPEAGSSMLIDWSVGEALPHYFLVPGRFRSNPQRTDRQVNRQASDSSRQPSKP